MASRCIERFSVSLVVFLLVGVFCYGSAWCGSLRLHMADGASIEVPYYWQVGGEVRFDVPGGVAGVPRSQVVSIQEVLDAREFDPEMLLQSAAQSPPDQRQMLQDLIASKTSNANCEVSDPEESLKQLKMGGTVAGEAEKVRIHRQKFSIERSLPVVCAEPGGPILFLQDILSSNIELQSRDFSLVLYDVEGNVISRKPCEVYPLALDQDARKKLQLKGTLYLVRAGIKPDPKIKRYEIAAIER